MRTLHHFWLSPFCRKIRIALREKNLDFQLQLEQVWQPSADFLRLNPAATVPVLVDENGTVVADSYAIAEYIEESYATPPLFGGDPQQRAETRRLVAWFDTKFHREVGEPLVREKAIKRFLRQGEPNSAPIRAGQQNIHYHLDYIAWLADRRTWLAGDDFSFADIAAGAHLSVVDYLGDVPWDQHEGARFWYQRIKSRPSMRPLLADHIPGLPPPAHYADLDF
ncbi:MAG: glutathione S-transferase family protein [Alphaproteobacteria bacterium]|nr:glutathione S-transferase family protein [Alphaproteobacteria bacterium]